MTDEQARPGDEPRRRFRRLLSEAEEAGETPAPNREARETAPGEDGDSEAAATIDQKTDHPAADGQTTGGPKTDEPVNSDPKTDDPETDDPETDSGPVEGAISLPPWDDLEKEPPASPAGGAESFPTSLAASYDAGPLENGGAGKTVSVEPAADSGDTQPIKSIRSGERQGGLAGAPAKPAPSSSSLTGLERTIPPVTGRSEAGRSEAGRSEAGRSETPTRRAPSLDENGFPLPRRVNEIDTDATRVTPAAYSPTARPPAERAPVQRSNAAPPPQRPPVSQPTQAHTPRPATPANRAAPYRSTPAGGYAPPAGRGRVPPGAPPRPPTVIRPAPRARNPRRTLGCLLNALFITAAVFLVTIFCGLAGLIFEYYQIARTLPDPKDLPNRASQFETTRILDRNGNSLYEILDPNAGRRTYVHLDKISPYLVAATVATEDKDFYNHPGVDIWAIARAFWQNYQGGGTVSGASTITQQLVRGLFFTPEERVEQTYQRKIREAILATEVTRRYSKNEILELYLNENYYGNLAYGVEAASETYFNTSVDKLTLGQAAFLAGLPQAPSIYDVYTNPEATFRRQEDVLVLMYQASQEQGCIYVSNSARPVCLDPVAVTQAASEIKNYSFKQTEGQMRYPHWVNFVRSQLEAQFDAQTIYRSGFSVYTTLDPGLQDMAQTMVAEQVQAMADKHATDGALVAIRPSTGEILAMVGSADFYNEAISGQVNMAVSPRQPGSAMKPVTYAAAFEKGWTPATLLWDVPTDFPPSGRSDDPRPPYQPVNYDGRFHGPVTVRTALANSYNIPAVKTLQFVGIYDDPNTPGEDGLLAFARRMGITTLDRTDYGLALTLGGGDVSLTELTGAFAIFANGGRRVPPVAITKILDHEGKVVYSYQPPAGDQVIRPEHAYLISSILSDNQARTPAFGADSVLNLPFPAAAKTGTTNDFRDNWTLGYTPDLAVGVWVGNADYTPMQNTSGLSGAAPVWSSFMQGAIQQITGGNPTPFSRPGGVVEQVICAVSGTLPSQWCPKQRSEIFAADQPPLPKEEDLWQKVNVDTWTGLKASSACPDFTADVFGLNVSDPSAKRWIKKDNSGQAWAEEMGFPNPVTFAPEGECKATDPRPKLAFTTPRDGQTIIESPVEIEGVADATQWFDSVRLDYGVGEDPVEWNTLGETQNPYPNNGELYSWDVSELPAGKVTLRLYLHSTQDTYAEKKIVIDLQVPTPTPTPTETPTATPSATNTPPPTDTPQPSATPQPTETATPSSTPTQQPSASATEKFPKATAPFPTLVITPASP